MNSIPKSPEPANDSNEESLNRSCSYLMEAIHLPSEVSCHTRKRASILSKKQQRFDEAFPTLKGMCSLHDKLEAEAKSLRDEVHGLSERNMQLVDNLSDSLRG
ncbi:unnamed protein product [Lactuca virosa]|uniref:Uncharacterized protein n=1 Tax=Lactuca virosa TaxID=75947 RepID=A0AAU9MQT9_9ASTR|nr:unnamed protein product [Lactuca virosa]